MGGGQFCFWWIHGREIPKAPTVDFPKGRRWGGNIPVAQWQPPLANKYWQNIEGNYANENPEMLANVEMWGTSKSDTLSWDWDIGVLVVRGEILQLLGHESVLGLMLSYQRHSESQCFLPREKWNSAFLASKKRVSIGMEKSFTYFPTLSSLSESQRFYFS